VLLKDESKLEARIHLQADEAYSLSPEYLKAGEQRRWKALRERHDAIEAEAKKKAPEKKEEERHGRHHFRLWH